MNRNYFAQSIASRRFAAFLFVLVSLASGALYGQFWSGDYSFESPGSIHQTLPVPSTHNATYAAGSYVAFTPSLSPGEGREDVQSYCNTCHSPSFIPMQPPLPAATWAAEVDKMEKAFGARFPEDVHQRIVQYLESHYTPETRNP